MTGCTLIGIGRPRSTSETGISGEITVRFLDPTLRRRRTFDALSLTTNRCYRIRPTWTFGTALARIRFRITRIGVGRTITWRETFHALLRDGIAHSIRFLIHAL